MAQPQPLKRLGHSAIVGQTGSGKTTLARLLLDSSRRNVIIDPKLEFALPDWMDRSSLLHRGNTLTAHTPDEAVHLIKRRQEHVIYKPRPEFTKPSDYDPVLEAIYRRGSMDVYIDECAMVCRTHMDYPEKLRWIMQQGRSKHIRMMIATQRPSGFPLCIVSECLQFYAFRVIMSTDIKRIVEFNGEYSEPPEYHFWYRGYQDARPYLCTVDLGGDRE
jgi:ABC-type dipeptide/oligopeptide/nickel transport system ATPase component